MKGESGPAWGDRFYPEMLHGYRALTLRLAGYDPVRADQIDEHSTLSDIAEATVLRRLDAPTIPDQ